MNIMFLVNEPIRDASGIAKKILNQVDALKNLGENVFLSYLEEKANYHFIGRYINGTQLDKYSKISFIAKLQRRCLYNTLFQFIKENDIKFIYIRYIHFANPFFTRFLKKLKSINVKIFIELPTYPYDKEYNNISFSARIAFSIEKVYRKQFQKYVARIVTLSDDKTIFEIPTIQISNGIDAKAIKIQQKRSPDGSLHLIGVATISFWHGYDRVIRGLGQYYKNWKGGTKKVFFHIVGDDSTTEALHYKRLVEEYRLDNYVIFYGKKSGKELDKIFDMMDIAVGSLGCHRIEINHIRSLKNREYCARGIPFFYSLIDPDFEDKNFIYKVSSNNEPIDINAIIRFWQNLKLDANEIRNYALENLSWEQQFKKILAEVYALDGKPRAIH